MTVDGEKAKHRGLYGLSMEAWSLVLKPSQTRPRIWVDHLLFSRMPHKNGEDYRLRSTYYASRQKVSRQRSIP